MGGRKRFMSDVEVNILDSSSESEEPYDATVINLVDEDAFQPESSDEEDFFLPDEQELNAFTKKTATKTTKKVARRGVEKRKEENLVVEAEPSEDAESDEESTVV